MEKVFEALMEKLEVALATNEQESDALQRLSQNLASVRGAIAEMEVKLIPDDDYNFKPEVGILFNKHLLPRLFAKLIFFQLCYEFESEKLYSIGEKHKHYCKGQLEIIHDFFAENRKFVEYYYSKRVDEDHKIFTAKNKERSPEIAKELYERPLDNTGCLRAAVLMAYEEFSVILKKELDVPNELVLKKRLVVTWAYSLTDLAEQLIGQFESNTTLVDGQPATMDWLIEEAAKKYSNVSVKSLAGLISNIQNRKSGPTLHHQRLMAGVKGRVERLLDGKRRKRLKNKAEQA